MKYLNSYKVFEWLNRVPYRINQNIPKIAEEMGYKGVDLNREYGFGSMGVVYSIGDNKLLKVTSDKGEAELANGLKGRNLKHLVNYYDVAKIELSRPGKGDPAFDETFAIIMEEVNPLLEPARGEETNLSDHESSAVNVESATWEVIDGLFTRPSYSDDQIFNSFNKHRLEAAINIYEVKNGLAFSMSPKEVKAFKSRARDFLNKVMKQRDEVLKELKLLGIELTDAHSGNVGFDNNGNFVIFDPSFGEGGFVKKVSKEVEKTIYI